MNKLRKASFFTSLALIPINILTYVYYSFEYKRLYRGPDAHGLSNMAASMASKVQILICFFIIPLVGYILLKLSKYNDLTHLKNTAAVIHGVTFVICSICFLVKFLL